MESACRGTATASAGLDAGSAEVGRLLGSVGREAWQSEVLVGVAFELYEDLLIAVEEGERFRIHRGLLQLMEL